MTDRQSSRRTDRRALRHDVNYPCYVVRQRDLAVVAHVGTNLSTNGVQVLTDARVLTGEPVHVMFQAPETKAWFTLPGTVARVLHGRRPNEWGRRLGIELERMTSLESASLQECSRMLGASDSPPR